MWDTRACGRALPVNSFTSRSSIKDATVRIGTEHPVFGHLPWTQQSRGCGLEGDFISVGYHSILEFNETERAFNGHVTNAQGRVSNENGYYGYGTVNPNGLDYAAVPTGRSIPLLTLSPNSSSICHHTFVTDGLLRGSRIRGTMQLQTIRKKVRLVRDHLLH